MAYTSLVKIFPSHKQIGNSVLGVITEHLEVRKENVLFFYVNSWIDYLLNTYFLKASAFHEEQLRLTLTEGSPGPGSDGRGRQGSRAAGRPPA